jgi:protein-L-isoaspartate(D-aspartate) O-methyltransferase
MLELLNPKKWDKILDIWSGSWWTTALLSHITWPQWYVLWLERINDLAIFWKQNMDKYKLNNVHIEKAWINLWITWKQFDKILVSASGDNIPNELIEQLVVWWVMVIPIQNSIYKIVKISSNNYFKEEYPNFVFVPLIKDR